MRPTLDMAVIWAASDTTAPIEFCRIPANNPRESEFGFDASSPDSTRLRVVSASAWGNHCPCSAVCLFCAAVTL